MKTKPPYYQDQELALEAKQGCPEARDRLAERLRCVPIFMVSRNRKLKQSLPPEDLEDLAQDVVAVVWRKLECYRGEAPLEGWIYRFCVLEMRNFVRQKTYQESRKLNLVDHSHDLKDLGAVRDDFYEDIYTGLTKIEPQHSQIIRLRHFSQMTFKEISKLLEISLNTAKTHYYRGLLKLKTYIDPQRMEGDLGYKKLVNRSS